MALDGYFLSKLKDELLIRAVGTKIDKVQQPSKDEILLTLRHRTGSEKLLICVRADAPPRDPPMPPKKLSKMSLMPKPPPKKSDISTPPPPKPAGPSGSP